MFTKQTLVVWRNHSHSLHHPSCLPKRSTPKTIWELKKFFLIQCYRKFLEIVGNRQSFAIIGRNFGKNNFLQYKVDN